MTLLSGEWKVSVTSTIKPWEKFGKAISREEFVIRSKLLHIALPFANHAFMGKHRCTEYNKTIRCLRTDFVILNEPEAINHAKTAPLLLKPILLLCLGNHVYINNQPFQRRFLCQKDVLFCREVIGFKASC